MCDLQGIQRHIACFHLYSWRWLGAGRLSNAQAYGSRSRCTFRFCGVFVNYTRTPDAQYPQAVNEIYAATKWVAEHGEEIEVDGKNLAIIGNSVGGNMTAVTTLMAKAKGGPQIKLQILMWPLVDADFETDSYQQFGEKRFLTDILMKWMYDLYID